MECNLNPWKKQPKKDVCIEHMIVYAKWVCWRVSCSAHHGCHHFCVHLQSYTAKCPNLGIGSKTGRFLGRDHSWSSVETTPLARFDRAGHWPPKEPPGWSNPQSLVSTKFCREILSHSLDRNPTTWAVHAQNLWGSQYQNTNSWWNPRLIQPPLAPSCVTSISVFYWFNSQFW